MRGDVGFSVQGMDTESKGRNICVYIFAAPVAHVSSRDFQMELNKLNIQPPSIANVFSSEAQKTIESSSWGITPHVSGVVNKIIHLQRATLCPSSCQTPTLKKIVVRAGIVFIQKRKKQKNGEIGQHRPTLGVIKIDPD